MSMPLTLANDDPTVRMKVVESEQPEFRAVASRSVWQRISALGIAGTVTGGIGVSILITVVMYVGGTSIPKFLRLSLTDIFWLSMTGLVLAVGRDFINRRLNHTAMRVLASMMVENQSLRQDVYRLSASMERQMAMLRAETIAQFESLPILIEGYGDRRATEEGVAAYQRMHATGTDGSSVGVGVAKLTVVKQSRRVD